MKILVITLFAILTQVKSYYFDLPIMQFDAIRRTNFSEGYDLEGAYGPNTSRLRGPNYPYIFMLLTGEEITDGLMVSLWAQL